MQFHTVRHETFNSVTGSVYSCRKKIVKSSDSLLWQILNSPAGVPKFCSLLKHQQGWMSAEVFFTVCQQWPIPCTENVNWCPGGAPSVRTGWGLIVPHWATGSCHAWLGRLNSCFMTANQVSCTDISKSKRKMITAESSYAKYNFQLQATV